MSYIENENTYSNILSQTAFALYFQNIIQFYSPTYLNTILQVQVIDNKNKITPEQIICVICGSCSAFFIILTIILFIIRKKQNNNLISDSIDMSYDDESTAVVYKSPHHIKETSDFESPYNTMDLKDDF